VICEIEEISAIGIIGVIDKIGKPGEIPRFGIRDLQHTDFLIAEVGRRDSVN
jgi:hypothetical protein